MAAAALVCGIFLVFLLVSFYHLQALKLTPKEMQIRTIFRASDGPCRQGDQSPCMASVQHMRALGDFPDGALLLGDCDIALYLHTLPHGEALAGRWTRDEITVPELMSMGNDAYSRNLNVCRSFWMYAQVKRDHVAVPEFVLNGGGS